MRRSVLTPNGVFARSGERLLYILLHLFQRLEKFVYVQRLQGPCLVDRLHALNDTISQGHGERVF